ncbi:hypothetical protein BDV96DRAFT_235781 [Lophiotrema nucula]|uniref:Uncharacterized protein n=1 Tax=Lophiotrema nucula TaxID=690887 RepID=A0A6A5YQN3_9PLEO|nr:hypothetical protein BDV96DRAFT_235781 [Lophiotrema nucula]
MLRAEFATEVEYIWQILGKKEDEFYTMMVEDDSKEILRYELQLLVASVRSLWIEKTLLDFLIADISRQIRQAQREETASLRLFPHESRLRDDWTNRHSPQILAGMTRHNWESLKILVPQLATLEEHSRQEANGVPNPLSTEVERARKHLQAIERLLQECEAQVERAGSSSDGKYPYTNTIRALSAQYQA